MQSFRKLLAATDFSGPARHALERAAMLARAGDGAVLTLMHVVNLPALEHLRHLLGSDAADIEWRLRQGAEAELAALAARLDPAGAVATRLASGNPLREIPAALIELDAEMLIMGARGANFVREFLLGSTTERVLRKTRRPVLAVKQRPHETYRRVLVPVDFSAHSAPAVALARVVAPGADITLLHAFEVEFESKLEFAGIGEARIEGYRVKARQQALADIDAFADAMIATLGIEPDRLARVVTHGPANLRILEKEQELGADLIVIGKHGQSALEDMLLGSVTKHLLAYSDCDVLVSGLG